MMTLFSLFAILLIAVLAIAATTIVSKAGQRLKIAALTMTVVVLGFGYYAGTELLGRPKPARLSFAERSSATAVLAGSFYEEGQAIYLWLIFPGQAAPRAYVFAWSQQTAEALLRAQARAQQNGTQVRVRGPLRGGEQLAGGAFEVAPPPASPVKTGS